MKPALNKRILIATDFFYPHWTGISKSLSYLLRALRKSHPVTVVTVQYSRKIKPRETVEQALVIRTPVTFSFSRTHFSFRFIFAFLGQLSRHDTVMVNSPCTYILPVAVLTKLFRKRLVIFHQGDLILPRGFMNRIIEWVFDTSTRMACDLADSVSTYTKDYADESRILKRYKRKFVPLLLPITRPLAGRKKNRIDTELEALKKKKHVLFGFAGRFVEEKGFDILFRAIPAITEKLPQARFVFAGEMRMGYEHFFDEKRRLWLKAEPFVTRLGLLSGEELASFYRQIDFMIMPSRSDCFPLVQVEVMLSGTPVIASNIPGLRVPVRETGFGKLFRKNDPDALADAVFSSVKTRQAIMKQKEKARAFLNPDVHSKTVVSFFAR